MKRIRITEGTGEMRTMYFVQDKNYTEHYAFDKGHWLYGEYRYVSEGILFADREDALLHQFLKTKVGRVLAHRLTIMQEYCQE